MRARFDEQGNYPVLIAIIVESGRQFPLDPLRFHRRGSQDDRKPIAPKECFANLVLPLLPTLDVMLAIPDRNFVAPQVARQTKRERLVGVAVRQEELGGRRRPRSLTTGQLYQALDFASSARRFGARAGRFGES